MQCCSGSVTNILEVTITLAVLALPTDMPGWRHACMLERPWSKFSVCYNTLCNSTGRRVQMWLPTSNLATCHHNLCTRPLWHCLLVGRSSLAFDSQSHMAQVLKALPQQLQVMSETQPYEAPSFCAASTQQAPQSVQPPALHNRRH